MCKLVNGTLSDSVVLLLLPMLYPWRLEQLVSESLTLCNWSGDYQLNGRANLILFNMIAISRHPAHR